MSSTSRSCAAATHFSVSSESVGLQSSSARADPAWAREAARQQALVSALFAPDRATARAAAAGVGARGCTQVLEAGLGAYRGNCLAVAERALMAIYPATCALLGESAGPAAVHLWRSDPPRSGDLGDWGASFPDWLAAQPSLADWPQLADCARIEWARHRADRAADAELDVGSLALLGTDPSADLRLQLKPDVAVVRGVVGFYETWLEASGRMAHASAAHALASSHDNTAATHVDAPATTAATAVAVWREGYAPRTEPLTPAWAACLDLVAAGAALQDLLAALPEQDLETALTSLISRGWLLGIATIPDIVPTEEST